MNATTEPGYSNGGSFTMMVRVNASTPDNAVQGLSGTSSNYLQFSGGGSGISIQSRLREGAGGGETSFYYNSTGNGGIDTPGGDPATAGGGGFLINRNTWYNVFLIYDANNSVTIAADDGTTFQYITTLAISDPLFDTLTNGYSDAERPPGLGVLSYGPDAPNTLDGSIESLVVFNRALSIAEADAINLSNVPEPATVGLLTAGVLCTLGRRRRRIA